MRLSLQNIGVAAGAVLLLAGCSSAPSRQNLVISGSDTEVQLISTLAESFTKTHDEANISVAGGGSAVGIAALINGETDIANSSRQMKAEEITKAKDAGRDPQEFIVARDGLSNIVHPDNPVKELTMEQLGKIFSGQITNWKEVGGNDAAIVLYGRQSTSGTFSFYRDKVVKGDYASSMRQMEGNQSIVDAVLSNKDGIGYVGVGYAKTEDGKARTDVKILLIAKTAGATAYSPLDRVAVDSGDYPIVRNIYQYLQVLPKKGSVAESFLTYEASADGQALVEKSGFYPLSAANIQANDALLAKIK